MYQVNKTYQVYKIYPVYKIYQVYKIYPEYKIYQVYKIYPGYKMFNCSICSYYIVIIKLLLSKTNERV